MTALLVIISIIGVGVIIAAGVLHCLAFKRLHCIMVAAVGVVLFGIGTTVVFVPTGSTGVRIALGQVSNQPMPNGLNIKVPFVQSIKLVDNKLQTKMFAEKAPVESTIKGKIETKITNISVSYRISPTHSVQIFKEVSNPTDLLTYSLVESAVKTATSTFTADAIVVRTISETEAKKQLQAKIDAEYGEGVLTIQQIQLGNIQFDDEYNKIIEQKNMAEQIQQKQAIENQTAVEKATAEAEAKRIEAQGNKDANELMEKSITNNILLQQYLEKWDGHLPKVTSSEGIMFDINSLMNELPNKVSRNESSPVEDTPPREDLDGK